MSKDCDCTSISDVLGVYSIVQQSLVCIITCDCTKIAPQQTNNYSHTTKHSDQMWNFATRDPGAIYLPNHYTVIPNLNHPRTWVFSLILNHHFGGIPNWLFSRYNLLVIFTAASQIPPWNLTVRPWKATFPNWKVVLNNHHCWEATLKLPVVFSSQNRPTLNHH